MRAMRSIPKLQKLQAAYNRTEWQMQRCQRSAMGEERGRGNSSNPLSTSNTPAFSGNSEQSEKLFSWRYRQKFKFAMCAISSTGDADAFAC